MFIIGGVHYTLTSEDLQRFPESLLHNLVVDGIFIKGNYPQIERKNTLFNFVAQLYKTGSLVSACRTLPLDFTIEALTDELDFYQMPAAQILDRNTLSEAVQEAVQQAQQQPIMPIPSQLLKLAQINCAAPAIEATAHAITVLAAQAQAQQLVIEAAEHDVLALSNSMCIMIRMDGATLSPFRYISPPHAPYLHHLNLDDWNEHEAAHDDRRNITEYEGKDLKHFVDANQTSIFNYDRDYKEELPEDSSMVLDDFMVRNIRILGPQFPFVSVSSNIREGVARKLRTMGYGAMWEEQEVVYNADGQGDSWPPIVAGEISKVKAHVLVVSW